MTAQRPFWKSVAATTVALLAFSAIQLPSPAGTDGVVGAFEAARRAARTRGLSAEAREAQATGYYQDLLDGASGVVTKTPTGINDLLAGVSDGPKGPPRLEEIYANQAPINDYFHDFLIYRPRPNVDLNDPRFNGVRHVTNSEGFNDGEYPRERESGTRRIVLLGDSMARALGVPPGLGFEPRLERYLNERHTSADTTKFEIINMGVSGYRITQVADLALQLGPEYNPDAYVVALTWLTVARSWGLHLAQLVDEDIDPKYDFLRGIIRDADLQKGETEGRTQARLRPFVVPTLRWGVNEIRNLARRQGASLTVVFLPHLKGIGSYEYDFGPVRKMLAEEDVPIVDLLDAFDHVDVKTLDVGDGLHPNADGHVILADLLYQRMLADDRVAASILGPATTR